MAYRRGSTRDDAIRVEEPQRNGDNQSTTRRPVVRRLVRPSNSIPADANVITLSDDEDGNQDQHHRPAEDDDEELQVAETSTAWTAAQNRRRSDHQALGDAGVPACAECTSTKRRCGHIAQVGNSSGPSLNGGRTPFFHHSNTGQLGPTNTLGLLRTDGVQSGLPTSLAVQPIPSPSHGVSLILLAASTGDVEVRSTSAPSLNEPSLQKNSATGVMAFPMLTRATSSTTPYSNETGVVQPGSLQVKTSVTLPLEGIAVAVEGGDRLELPIGTLTEGSGEQTTSSRVNTTLATERVSVGNEGTDASNLALLIGARARRSQGSSLAKVPSKQRAVKSVNPIEPPEQTTRRPAKQHQPSQTRERLQSHISRIAKGDELSADAALSVSRRRALSKEAPANSGAAAESYSSVQPEAQNVSGDSTPIAADHDKEIGTQAVLGHKTDHLSATLPPLPDMSATRTSTHLYHPLQTPTSDDASTTIMSRSDGLGDVTKTSEYQVLSRAMRRIDTSDISSARSVVKDCLRQHLDKRHETHGYLTASEMWRQRTCHERELRVLSIPGKNSTPPALPSKYVQAISPFANMASIQAPLDKRLNKETLRDISQEVFTRAKPKDTVNRSSWVIPTTAFKSDVVFVPPFKEYVSLKDNILADNESKMLATPYFQDEDYDSRFKLLKSLPRHYELKHDENPLLDLRIEQCRFYKESIENFLREINVTWDDILFWLLAPNEMIKQISNSAEEWNQYESLILERSHHHIDVFERDAEIEEVSLFERTSQQWRAFLSSLQKPTARGLKLSALACISVFNECHFTIWYLTQQCETVRRYIAQKIKDPIEVSNFGYKDVQCRVCHQHNCLYHGELREEPDDASVSEMGSDNNEIDETEYSEEEDDDDDDSQKSKPKPHHSQPQNPNYEAEDQDEELNTLPAHFADDPVIEKVINYKFLANPNAVAKLSEKNVARKGLKPPEGKFNSKWWLQHSYTHEWEKRTPFFPCYHDGPCDQANCRCYRENINCEKSCKCSRSCNRRFPGCNCPMAAGKRVCVPTTCLCNKFNRECDADLCGTCGAMEVLDPVNRYNEEILQGRCSNVAIQRGVPRKTLLGSSEVHGFGLYMGEDIKKGDYIGEYAGETISVGEGDRRVTVYEYQQTMYSFRLNKTQEVDATYMGNKQRFINNADRKYTNCEARNLFCNTVFRLALYASTDIKAGTELFFDYHYPKEQTKHFKQPKVKELVAVKQAVKQTTKQKNKNKSTDPLSYRSSPSSTPKKSSDSSRARIFAATAKARAVKAERHAARLAEKESSDSASRRFPESGQMRSTVDGNRSLRLSRTKTSIEDGNDSPGTIDETVATEDPEDSTLRRYPGRKRRAIPRLAPVIAVKNTVGKSHNEIGRKRKRPVVFNSDDE